MIVCSTLLDLSRHWKKAHPERGLNLRPERLLETERNPTVQDLGSRKGVAKFEGSPWRDTLVPGAGALS